MKSAGVPAGMAQVISMSLPEESVQDMDALIESRGFKGRSEVLRAALRDFLKLHRAEERLSGAVNAILVLVYPEETERVLSDLRHAYNDVVTSMLHAHTTQGRCATVLLAEGQAGRMKRFIAELRGLRAIDSIEVTIL